MFLWLQQRLLEQAVSQNADENLEEGLAMVGPAPPPPPTLPTIAFVDLSGYTRMTEERGDKHAVEYAAALHDHAKRCARDQRGCVVKMLGDGAMAALPRPFRRVGGRSTWWSHSRGPVSAPTEVSTRGR